MIGIFDEYIVCSLFLDNYMSLRNDKLRLINLTERTTEDNNSQCALCSNVDLQPNIVSNHSHIINFGTQKFTF